MVEKIKVQFVHDLQFIKKVNPALYEELRKNITDDKLSKISEAVFHRNFHKLKTEQGMIQVFAEITQALVAIYYNARQLGHIFLQLELFQETDILSLLKNILENVQKEDIELFKAFFKNTTPFPHSPAEIWEELKTYMWQLPVPQANSGEKEKESHG